MADRFSNMNVSGQGPRMPLRWRTLAVLVMVAGAISFAISLVAFEDQTLCLFGSTLITLVGLGMIIHARRRGWEPAPGSRNELNQPDVPSDLRRPGRVRMPRGLRNAKRAMPPAQSPVQAPMPDPLPVRTVQPPAPRNNWVAVTSLPGRVIEILSRQGAQVTVESRRENRFILRIVTRTGQVYPAMVLEDDQPVDVSDVRALMSLINSSGSTRGYLIAQGAFTPRAYSWAAERPQVRLVGEDELDELGV